MKRDLYDIKGDEFVRDVEIADEQIDLLALARDLADVCQRHGLHVTFPTWEAPIGGGATVLRENNVEVIRAPCVISRGEHPKADQRLFIKIAGYERPVPRVDAPQDAITVLDSESPIGEIIDL